MEKKKSFNKCWTKKGGDEQKISREMTDGRKSRQEVREERKGGMHCWT